MPINTDRVPFAGFKPFDLVRRIGHRYWAINGNVVVVPKYNQLIELQVPRKALEWEAAPFEIPDDVCDAWRIAGLRSNQESKDWNARLKAADANIRGEFERRHRGDLPSKFGETIQTLKKEIADEQPTKATRKASQAVLEAINGVVPETIAGSADLTGSNNTNTSHTAPITSEDFSGRFIHYGIREHAMASAMNGMALHGGLLPYSGGFLIFSDYCRPSLRLAALMQIRAIHVMTHDSIGLGEDGPTHQPVEQLASLRAIPNLNVFRPADMTETAECWQLALENQKTPSVIALTRQNLEPMRPTYEAENLCSFGAYESASAGDDNAQVSIFASGSEVEIANAAKAALDAAGHPTRVVSVPCFELFQAQSAEYRKSVLGDAPVKIAVEAAIRQGWDAFIGSDGIFVGMQDFGASAPYKELYDHFGITSDAIFKAATEQLNKQAEV